MTLLPKTDVLTVKRHVRFGSKADICAVHSMASSARGLPMVLLMAALAHTGGRMNVTARGHQKPVATSYRQR